MKQAIIALAIILNGAATYAQDLAYKDFDWEKDPTWTEIDTALTKDQEVVLDFNKIVEFAYSEEYDNRLVQYVTIHRKTRVLNDDGIQSNNKVYIGMGKVLNLVEAKARVITPENKVIDFDESNILDSESEDSYDSYKYFAIDGAVKGSDIEFVYTVLRIPSYDGIRNTFQDEYPTVHTKFTVISPSNLEFAFKSYNGFPDMVMDTAETERNIYSAESGIIEALRDEDYSAYRKNLQHVIYKLDKNTATHTSNIVSFGDISQNIYQFYRSELEKKDQKAIKKLVASSEAAKQSTEEQKVWKLENYIKSEIMAIEGVPMNDINGIIDDHFTSEMGMSYLLSHALAELGVEFEVVLTCDRFDAYFDEDFENYYVIDNVMFYFPKIKKYMAPGDNSYRLGLVPSAWTNQNGLFVKEVGVGDIKAGVGKVKFIDPVPYDATNDNMKINIDFTDITEPEIDFERELSGYSCVYFQSIYHLLEDDNKKELDESLIKFADEKGEVISYEVSGIEDEEIGVKPMVYKGKMKSSSLVEKAGNRYLFNLGNVIGPQMEMYQEEERVLDIEHDHNMAYHREITFEIPEGYEISGLDAVKINEEYPNDGAKIYFKSDYKVEGNIVTITVDEVYQKMLFDKSEIDEFRRIINAAANFNKIVLFINQK